MHSTAQHSTAQHSTAQHSTAQRNYSVDTLKFFCAFLVVLVHTGGPLSIDILIRIAVPCFFIISGYFIYNPYVRLMQDKLLATLKKICIITAWSTILYATISFVSSINDIPAENSITFVLIAKKVIALLLFNNPVWGFHLWYLFAYIYTIIAVFYLYKFKVIKLALYSIPILLSISVLFGLYSFLIFDSLVLPSMMTRNFLFCGIPYFLVGILTRKNLSNIFKQKKVIYLSTIIIVILTVLEHLINPRSLGFGPGAYFITTAPLSILIFILTLLIKQTKDNLFSKIGRNDSLYIYIFHPLTMMILGKISTMFLIKDSLYYEWSYSILVFLITLFGSIFFRVFILPQYQKIIARFR